MKSHDPPTSLDEGVGAIHELQLLPDLTPYWKLIRPQNADSVFLQSKQYPIRHEFSPEEGSALRYFSGKFTPSQVQRACQKQLGDLPEDFVVNLVQKLTALRILAWEDAEDLPPPTHSAVAETPDVRPQNRTAIRLKDCVQWIEHPEGYWILRNPEDLKFIQVQPQDKAIIDALQTHSAAEVAVKFGVAPHHIKTLLQQLTVTAMLEGTTPPKPPKRKFNPMQLLFFRIPLFDPDRWLSQHINKLRWIWTRSTALLLTLFLFGSAIIGYSQKADILHAGQQLLTHAGGSLLLPFGLLAMVVVTCHELGHAFTLKHYGGIVPKMGLLMIMLMPAAYTDTTDSYCLIRRYQRVLVVAAGIIVQFILAAIALLLWNWSNPGSWPHTASYLLMAATLFTVALNLNPLARFDGYYLMSALTGINNLRSRSFKFYQKLLTGKPIPESHRDAWILAGYAPLSLAYLYFVFGFLLIRVADWSLTNIPTISLLLLSIWAIYFFSPEPDLR